MSANVSLRASAPTLSVIDGIPTTLSTEVAAMFGKRHAHVLRDIENLIAQLPPERQPNFGLTSIEIPGPNGATRQSPAYRLTRDGFTLLAMGFTGSKALAFKLAYIEAFNKMEHMLRGGDAAIELRELRQTVGQLVEITKALVTKNAPKAKRASKATQPRDKMMAMLVQSGGWLTHSHLLRYSRATSAEFARIVQSELKAGTLEARRDGRVTLYKIGGAA